MTTKLRKDSRENEVFRLQSLLNRHGGKLVTDGSFGPLTEAVVKAFQRGAGLAVDGIVNVPGKTWNALRMIPAATDEELALKDVEVLSFGRDFEVINDYFEGVDLNAHQVGGLWHIGKGHSETSKRPPLPRKGMTITWREMVDIWERDKAAVLTDMKKALAGSKPMTQRFFDALGSLWFNRQRTFKNPDFLRSVKEGDHEVTIAHWRAIAKAPALDGRVYRGLAIRRETEINAAIGGPYKLGE
jgi:GH24 family phage-related lysozyme (muramidase)